MKENITRKLTQAFSPELLEVIDESFKHEGHREMHDKLVRETHFKIKIRAKFFKNKTLIESHKLIYKLLDIELAQQGVHALAIELMSEKE